MALRAGDGDLAARLGRFDALAVAVIVGRPLCDVARQLVADWSARPVVRRAAQLQAALPLADDGCILRVAGTSVEEVGRTLRESLSFVPGRLGDNPWKRKW